MTISGEVLRNMRALAAKQDWVVTTAQLRAAGAERADVRRMLRAGQWLPLTRGSYWIGRDARGPSLRARVRGLLLTCGSQAMAAGPTAARLLGIQGLPPDDGTLHLATLHATIRNRQGVHIHRTLVPDHARTTLRGIPLTTPARTCADLLLQLPRAEAVSVLDSALHQGVLTSADRLTLPTHLSGRPGARQARTWIPLANARAESPLETRIRLICLDGGLPPPVLQWPIPDPERGRAFRIDLGWPAQRVGTEADGQGPMPPPKPSTKTASARTAWPPSSPA
ncbi:type IV toxin-antitoxin system AbiEi family antitoxin domain-containing protein [Streptomyces sparsogenes]|uniref:type IV toxin-antitoxin system AbiEi family antitoxin domain-containing protein n=1 Tax=Streptomyces sparsogenes TaxID=67365 RepID=UPI0033DD150E